VKRIASLIEFIFLILLLRILFTWIFAGNAGLAVKISSTVADLLAAVTCTLLVREVHLARLDRRNSPDDWKVQTRSQDGELRFFDTFDEAKKHAKSDWSVWKISMTLHTGERLRLVKNEDGQFFEEGILDA
jgi:hypothetical protein